MTNQSEFAAEQAERQERVTEFESFLAQAMSKGTVVLPDTEQPATEPPATDEGA